MHIVLHSVLLILGQTENDFCGHGLVWPIHFKEVLVTFSRLSDYSQSTQYIDFWLAFAIIKTPLLTWSARLWAAQRCLLQFHGCSCAGGHCKDREAALKWETCVVEFSVLSGTRIKHNCHEGYFHERLWFKLQGEIGARNKTTQSHPPPPMHAALGQGPCPIQIKRMLVGCFKRTKVSLWQQFPDLLSICPSMNPRGLSVTSCSSHPWWSDIKMDAEDGREEEGHTGNSDSVPSHTLVSFTLVSFTLTGILMLQTLPAPGWCRWLLQTLMPRTLCGAQARRWSIFRSGDIKPLAKSWVGASACTPGSTSL